MTIYKKDYTQFDRPFKIVCNFCGNEIEKDTYNEFYDHMHFEKVWGYLSEKDGVKHEFDLCEKCYDEFVSSFKIKINEK